MRKTVRFGDGDIKKKIIYEEISVENMTKEGEHNFNVGRKVKKEGKKKKTTTIKNKWKLEVLNPITSNIEEEYYFPTLAQLAKRMTMFNYDTWRNIALGRSKTYTKFVNLEKLDECNWNENIKMNINEDIKI